MRKLILRLGHIRVTIAVTILLTLLSFITTHYIAMFFDIPMQRSHYLLAFGIPALIVPVVIWYIFKLYFTIEELESKMRELATYDSLTGLYRRYAFLELGQEVLERIGRNNGSAVILYIDIDDFKQLNDTYGHENGDKILALWGSSMLKIFRAEDIIGRIGGEEAAVILPDINLEETARIVHRLQQSLRDTPILFHGERITFSISVGVALAEKDTSLITLLSRADRALYHAKAHGKDCSCLFQGEKHYRFLTEDTDKAATTPR